MIAESNQGLCTIPQLAQFFLPKTAKGLSLTPEYTRLGSVIKALYKRGDIIRLDPLPGTYTPIYGIADGGIKKEGLDSLCPTREEKLAIKKAERTVPTKPPMVVAPESPPTTIRSKPSNDRAIPRMDDIYTAIEDEFKKSPMGVTVQTVHSHFPDANSEDVRLRLNVMESEGMVSSTKVGIAKFYRPIQQEKLLPLPSAKTVKKEIKRALGFGCEVCDALVGVRAQPAISTITCNSCGAVYMVEKRLSYRLGLGIAIQIWTPGNGKED